MATVPERAKNVYKRALEGLATPKNVIRAKCNECCGFEDVPKRIWECRVFTCPLWAYRQQPYKDKKRKGKNDEIKD